MATTATVPQGSHFDNFGYSNTPDIPLSMWADIHFQNSCQYDLGNNDQYDWNKLIGFAAVNSTFNFRSARWGWRWSLSANKVEIAPYVHDSSTSALLPPSFQWIQVDLNSWFNVGITLERSQQKIKFDYSSGGTSITHYVDIPNTPSSLFDGICATDLLYFGGNRTAPHDISIDYNNISFSTPPRQYNITGEASNGVNVTGLYPDGSLYNQFLNFNQTVTTPCLMKGSLSSNDITILELGICN